MAMGLAERVAELVDGEVTQHDLSVNGPRAWLASRLPWASPGTAFSPDGLPSLVVGAGRRVAPIVASLQKKGVKTVQVLDPKMNLKCFDRVIVPQHDQVSGENVLPILGSLGRISASRLIEAKDTWASRFAHLSRPLMAVSLGGNTKRKQVPDAAWEQLIQDLGALSSKVGMVITTSRRSGADIEARLRQSLPKAMIWDGHGDNPYFGMLACADCLLVTDDSINMASEAAATGKPLAIYPLLEEGGKTARFHEALIAAGYAERFRGIPTTHAMPLDETSRIAAKVASLL